MSIISSTAEIDSIRLKESAAPSTPASGYGQLYEKTDGKLYFLNDAATETCITDVAPNNAQFLTLATSSSLTVERVFTPGIGLTATDGGAGSTYTLDTLIAQNSKSADYTLVLSDGGKHILHPTADNNARVFTIPANASVAYPIGTAITFVNQINTVSIAITSDTLTLAGAGTTGTRTLAANGMATALKIASTVWFISGTGLT
jgi:hypothetical protein